MHAPVTLAQIAKEVGTTTATVSMALRGKPGISSETTLRVKEAAERLGYRPDPRFSQLMQFLRTRKDAPFHAVIAYIHDFPNKDGYCWLHTHSEFFLGARKRGAELGFEIEPFWVREPGMSAGRMRDILRARGIPGAIFTTPSATTWPLTEEFEGLGVAVVGYTEWLPQYCRACSNQHHSMLVALANLERLGYRRIGLALSSQDDANAEHNWLSAYLGHHHALPRERRIAPLLGSAQKIFTRQVLGTWIEKYRPDCVIGHTNPLLDRILELGHRVPRDIGFASLDLFPRDDGLACSGVDQVSAAVGSAALELVVGQIAFRESGCREHPRLVLIEGVWRDGATTSAKRSTPAKRSAR
jgi:LacI family transcriptional regulator